MDQVSRRRKSVARAGERETRLATFPFFTILTKLSTNF